MLGPVAETDSDLPLEGPWLLRCPECNDVEINGNLACAIRTNDGSLLCESYSDNDEWDDIPSGSFIDIALGTRAACAVNANGTIVCWGDPEWGQTDPPDGSFYDVEMGGSFGCGLGESNACWGNPALDGYVPPSNTVQFATADDVVCALTDVGKVICNDPLLDVNESTDLKQIDITDTFACGLDSGGLPRCWGHYDDMLGPPPVDYTFDSIQLSFAFACGLTKNGHARCWGSDAWNGTMEITTWEIE